MRYIFAYYHQKSPDKINQEDIISYINFIKTNFGSGRDKCRMVAQSCSFFYKHILPIPFIVPSAFYPRKEFRLPNVLSENQVSHLLNSINNLKHKCIIGMFYGSGLRCSELQHLEYRCIDSQSFQVKVENGKGSKQRFSLLPKTLLEELRRYYKEYRPKRYLFEGKTPGKPMHERSIQHAVRMCMKQAGFEPGVYSSHTLRHSFATHLLDNGTDLPTIKELLGHVKIETTMVYIHLQKKKRQAVVSPLDQLIDYGKG